MGIRNSRKETYLVHISVFCNNYKNIFSIMKSKERWIRAIIKIYKINTEARENLGSGMGNEQEIGGVVQF